MITLADVETALAAIRPYIDHTPCMRSDNLSRTLGCSVYLKLENLQMTGAFKERGALNKMLSLPSAIRQRGVVAASAGNHAQGVAYHAQRMGGPATIFMPEMTPITKVNATRRFGAEVVLHGQNYDEAYEQALEYCSQEGLPFIHPFDDPLIMAGQGTIGMEIIQDGIEPDAVIVPIGGGGLMAGIATAIKQQRPQCRMIGVQMKRAPGMKASLDEGEVVQVETAPSLADGITVKRVGELTFGVAHQYVDEIVLVDEEEAASSVLTLLEKEKCLVEGAGAVPLAALQSHGLGLEGKRVVLILSGGNIDMNQLSRIIERGLINDGRMAKLRVTLKDVPGQLASVSNTIAHMKANVLEVYHNRSFFDGPFGGAFLDITLETRGREHLQEIQAQLEAEGYTVRSL